MQASRASSRALKQLAAGSRQTRSLHMTGPATFSSLLTSERPALNLPRDVAGLRAECQKRKLPTSGTKAELIDRLSAHEIAGTRAFSTVRESKRPTAEAATPGTPVRHFNTSRTLKAVNDTSTIDFAYIPDFDPDMQASPIVRVPILPETITSAATKAHTAAEVEEAIIHPTLSTVHDSSEHIHAPAFKTDASESAIDFTSMAAKVAERLGKPVEESASMARQIWSGFVDDVLGPKNQGTPSRA